MTLELLPPAAGPAVPPRSLSTLGNKPRIGHEKRSVRRSRAGADATPPPVPPPGQRCIHTVRVSWDVRARCALEEHRTGPHAVTRASVRTDAASSRSLGRPLRLPVRRRVPSGDDPDAEQRERRLRDATKLGMADAIRATLAGLDGPPEAVIHGHRRLLERAIGKLESCRTVQVIEELNCHWFRAIPFSCHLRPCPDCELLRTARFARIGEALVRDAGGESVCSFIVLTAFNARFGELEVARRRHQRHLARMRATPPFAGGPCSWHGHGSDFNKPWTTPDGRTVIGHRGIPGGFSAMECPVSERTPGTWNLHSNLIVEGAPYVPKEELRWFWRRITCPRHRRNCPGTCPHYRPGRFGGCDGICAETGKRSCRGGAWDVYINKLEAGKVREAIKYVTKSAEILRAGAGAVVEFIIAMRGAKLITRWGSFRDRELVVDEQAQAEADKDLVETLISPHHWRKLEAVCPVCKNPAVYDPTSTRAVARRDLRLVAGYLMWRPPPAGGP